ncbi:MAG: DUF3667 domain-containing protein [Bacteroidales bacterium]|nr:DUF3667 domain-containing protein [Bacteroidales bacterium]
MAKKKGKKHPAAVRYRAFTIWQKLGVYPWKKPDGEKGRKKSGDFYKGAFDSIPFLNDDAKRTFVHLLLRPGYMIRDYIKGEHEKYLAPLTALIIFYAFFALVSSVLQPMQHERLLPFDVSDSTITINENTVSIESERDTIEVNKTLRNVAHIVQRGYIYLHLDQYPEEVHTQSQASLAALESALRNQGIPLFISDFLILWLAMAMALRRRKLRMSACAAASAYVLCQFSFFMLFAVLLSWGKSASISAGLMMLLLVIDYRQWLNLPWKESIKRTISTGIYYALIYLAVILAISALVLLLALFK